MKGKYVLMSYKAHVQEQRALAENNFKNGVTRGEKNLIFFLNEVRLGRMALKDVQMEGLDEKERDNLNALIFKLMPQRGMMQSMVETGPVLPPPPPGTEHTYPNMSNERPGRVLK